jgi:hypothetical protein
MNKKTWARMTLKTTYGPKNLRHTGPGPYVVHPIRNLSKAYFCSQYWELEPQAEVSWNLMSCQNFFRMVFWGLLAMHSSHHLDARFCF